MKNLFTCIVLIFLLLAPASGESKQPDRRQSGRQQNREQAVQQRSEQTNWQPSRMQTGNHGNAKPESSQTAVTSATSRAAESRSLTDIPYTAITLPYSQTAAAFNPVAGLDDDLCYIPLKFTLSATTMLRFSGYTPDADEGKGWGPWFNLYDGNMNPVERDGWFNGYWDILPAGTYYLILDDDSYKAKFGKTYMCDLSISAADNPFTQITLPYSQTAAAFNPVAGLKDYLCYVPLKFTLSATTMLHFSGYNPDAADGGGWAPGFNLFDGELNQIDGGWFDGYIRVLPAGTYYLLVNDAGYKDEYGEIYTCDLSIKAVNWNNVPFTQITLPYSKTAVAFNPVAELGGNRCYIPLKFILSAAATIHFAGYNDDESWGPYFELFDGNMDPVERNRQFDSYWKILSAGTYYLLVNDDSYKVNYGETFTYNLNISAGTISVDTAVAPDNAVKVYTSGRTVYVEEIAPGSLLSFFDVAGRLLIQKAATSDRESYTTGKPGIYLVRVQNEVFKIICR